MNEEQTRLRGVLAKAFNNKILCMRGFARIKYLAMTSRVDESYQRALDQEHMHGLQEFLNKGHYRFFPELIFGLSLESIGCKDPQKDMEALLSSVETGKGFQVRAFGDQGVMMSSFAQGHVVSDAFDDGYVALSIMGLPTDPEKRCLFRIDGNHRLNVVEKMLKGADNLDAVDMQVPYCLVIFESQSKCQEHSAVFFHNINFHHLPVPEDHLLKLVIERDDMFRDEALKEDPSLGEKYYLARRFDSIRVEFKKRMLALMPSLATYWYDFLVGSFDLLRKRPVTIHDCSKDVWEGDVLKRRGETRKNLLDGVGDEIVIKEFANHLNDVLVCILNKGQGKAYVDINAGALIAMVYERHRSQEAMEGFWSWYSSNRLEELKGEILDHAEIYRRHISATELVEMYENFAQQKGHEIFVSMAFGKDETENHYMVIERVVREINNEIKPTVPLVVRRVDCMDRGWAYEINHVIGESIMGCGLLIANLTYVNPNVYHEVGLAMGGALARNRDPGSNMLLILDTSVEKEKCDVGFNLWSFRQIRFTQSEILGQKLKNEILVHFGFKRSE